MTITNGNEPKNLVPIGVRHPLIKSWVFCKQLLNQPIPRNLGHDDEVGYLVYVVQTLVSIYISMDYIIVRLSESVRRNAIITQP
jgi:hypothetical protein